MIILRVHAIHLPPRMNTRRTSRGHAPEERLLSLADAVIVIAIHTNNGILTD